MPLSMQWGRGEGKRAEESGELAYGLGKTQVEVKAVVFSDLNHRDE